MQPKVNEQIKQIIPAHEEYYAVLLDTEEPFYRVERIVGWALVEFEDADSERQSRIVGLSLFSSGVWLSDSTKEFFEYVHEDQLTQHRERFRNQGFCSSRGRRRMSCSRACRKGRPKTNTPPRSSRRRPPSSASVWRTSENTSSNHFGEERVREGAGALLSKMAA